MNLLVAAAVFLFLRSRRSAPPAARFFLWLFGAVNLLTALGYPIYSGVGGIGDFARNLGNEVRANPLPVALIGAGLAWLMMSNGRSARMSGNGGMRLVAQKS